MAEAMTETQLTEALAKHRLRASFDNYHNRIYAVTVDAADGKIFSGTRTHCLVESILTGSRQ